MLSTAIEKLRWNYALKQTITVCQFLWVRNSRKNCSRSRPSGPSQAFRWPQMHEGRWPRTPRGSAPNVLLMWLLIGASVSHFRSLSIRLLEWPHNEAAAINQRKWARSELDRSYCVVSLPQSPHSALFYSLESSLIPANTQDIPYLLKGEIPKDLMCFFFFFKNLF